MFNIIDYATGFKADFFPLTQTAFEQAKFQRRRSTEFLDQIVPVISPEDLLLSKLVWIQELQSALQLKDIENLLQIHSIDKEYIINWIKKLNLFTFDLPL